MVIDYQVVFKFFEWLMMMRLTVNQQNLRKVLGGDFIEFCQGDLKESCHCEIVESTDLIEMCNRYRVNPAPENALQRHGRCHGVRVGVYGNQGVVLRIEKRQEFQELIADGSRLPVPRFGFACGHGIAYLAAAPNFEVLSEKEFNTLRGLPIKDQLIRSGQAAEP